jgi:hypothetical protein
MHSLILGPDLQRLDGMGVLERIVRPYGRFRSSAKSTFDQICYFSLIIVTLAGIAIFLFALITCTRAWLRWVALVYLVLFVVGVWGFFRVADWI